MSLLVLLGLIGVFAHLDSTWATPPYVPHHNLTIAIDPQSHRLTAEDLITFPASTALPETLEFTLNPNFNIDHVRLNNLPLPLTDILIRPDSTEEGWRIRIPLPKGHQSGPTPTIAVHYHGTVTDQPTEIPGLRFTTPDKTTGYIGPEGVYLTSETLWYPTMSGVLATFHVHSTVPSEWETVTQGTEVSHNTAHDQTIAEWEITTPSEALTLVANRFDVQKRIWKGITIATYLFPEDGDLSEQYLDATIHYLDFYITLLGPYPFSQFAVVENFFPAGLGLPSYTLLGNQIIKRGYTQPYSLGHEIVHSWFGNSIYNRFSEGNWVEGLTTYLANYYYEEARTSSEAALHQREHMLFEYNLYTDAQHEYAIRRFHHKETRIDNAIGYQKTALVFHMLRQEVGDEYFWDGIRQLVRDWTGRHVDWHTIEHVFSRRSGRNLQWFFQQWVERAGAPSINIAWFSVQTDVENPGHSVLQLRLSQHAPYYRLRLPTVIHLADGTRHQTITELTSSEETFRFSVPSRPVRVVIDPAYMILQRLTRSQIPPMLNAWVTDSRQSVILDEANTSTYQMVLQRLRAQNTEILQPSSYGDTLPTDRSLLILDYPTTKRLAEHGLAGCEKFLHVGQDWIMIHDKKYAGPHMAWLVSCVHPDNPDHIVSLFSGGSPSAIARVARLLFFYGWDSYLIFENGKVIDRGLFDPATKHLDISLPAA